MKTRVVFLALLLASVSSSPELAAQTKKTRKQRTTATVTTPKSEAADKTRARRTAQTTPAEQAETPIAAQAETTPAAGEKKQDSEKPAVVESEAKPTVTAPAQTTTPPDEFAALREPIDAAATGPERIRLQLKLVDALVEAGKRTEAVAELHSIGETDVFDPQGFYNVGNAFARLGDTEGAVQAYRKAIEQRKGRYSRAYNNLGVVMLRVGRWDESYDALLSALKLESFRYPEASYNLGRLYAARGQNDLAAREWRRVLAQNPEHKAAAEALARIGSEGRVVVAAAPKPVVASAKEVTKPVAVPTKTVPAAVRGPKTLTLDPDSYDLLQRARSSTEKGNPVDAIGNYQRLLSRLGGYFAPANLELSFALMSLKRYDEALGNLQLVVNRDGARYPISYFHLARVNEIQGNLKTAEELFSKTASLFGSQNAQFLLDVSRVREKMGDFKGALEAMEQYLTQIKQQGLEPSWSDERLTALRQKVSASPKE